MDVKKLLFISSVVVSIFVYKTITLKIGPSAPEMEMRSRKK